MFRTLRHRGLCLLLPLSLLPGAVRAQQTPDASGDPIARIKDEGLNHSQVMQTLSYLTDVIGPRLTGSASLKRANEWTRDTMTEWGLQNAHLEAWGPFGRGWELERFSAQVTSPQDIPLIAYPESVVARTERRAYRRSRVSGRQNPGGSGKVQRPLEGRYRPVGSRPRSAGAFYLARLALHG